MNRLMLIGFLVIFLAGALIGIDFGLPNQDHTYPYHPDEWYTFQMLRGMNPSRLDFSPHRFEYPSLPFYLWGAIFAGAHVVRFVNVTGSERYFFEHPENLYRMMILGRLWVVLFGIGTVWLTYLTARRIGLGRNQSLFAALLMALHPAFVVESHFMKTNVMLVFFIMATLLAADHWIRRGGTKAAILAGSLAGLALSMKYTGALLAPILILAGILLWRRRSGTAGAAVPGGRRSVPGAAWSSARETIFCGLSGLVVFLLGTPYAVLTPGEFWASVTGFGETIIPAGSVVEYSGMSPWRIISHLVVVHATSSTPFVVALSVVGAGVLVWRHRNPLTILVMAWLAVFLLTCMRASEWAATDSRALPAFPYAVLLAAVAVGAVWRWRRSAGVLLGVISVAGCAVWMGILLARFIGPMPQELASDWARQNLTGREKILLASKAIYWNPDLPLREYLQRENQENYERQTEWTFVEGKSYTEARAQEPDIVFLTVSLPRSPVHLEWLEDPAYEVVAEFPGKVNVLGRRLHVWIDFWDVDIWVLRHRAAVR